MSRHLPPRPNLDHLKKQAKELLHDLLRQNPAVKLAYAQHVLAREYGFASWPKLKAHVESLPPPKASPFVGRWTANLSKSRRHPAHQFRSAVLQVDVIGDIVTVSDVVVSDSGHEERGKHTVRADGHERPSEHNDGYVLTAGWRGSHVLETIAKKDGQVAGWGTYEVSADGKTLTISADQQMIVLDRM